MIVLIALEAMKFLSNPTVFRIVCSVVAWTMLGLVFLSILLNTIPITEGFRGDQPGWPLAWFTYVTPTVLYWVVLGQVGLYFHCLAVSGAFDQKTISQLKRLCIILFAYALSRMFLAAIAIDYRLLAAAWEWTFTLSGQRNIIQIQGAILPFALALALRVMVFAFEEGRNFKQEVDYLV
jgi:hypothetical protein